MPEWPTRTVGSLLSSDRGISVGVMYPGENFDGGVPLIRVGDLVAGKISLRPTFRISPEVHREYRRTELVGGECLITLVGRPGMAAVVPAKMAGWNAARALAVLRLIDPDDAQFLTYALAAPEVQNTIRNWCNTTVQATLNLKEIKQLPVPWPEARQRAQITSALCALDDKIELNRRMNETLEAMARAIFKDWFVAFGPTRAKMEGRPPYLAPDVWALFPDRLDAEGKPEGWTLGTLADVISILETGGRPRGGVSRYLEGVPSIGAESIVGLGIYDYSKTKFVPRGFFDGMTKGPVESRDVLLYKDGGRPGEFEPHATLVGDGFPFEECAINEHVYRIRAMPAFGQTLLFFALTSEALMAEMRLKGTGVAIPGLNSTQARSLTMLMPSQAVADAFNATTEPLIRRILANCNESRTLAQTRDLLLPRLMSGELRVKDAEPLVAEVA